MQKRSASVRWQLRQATRTRHEAVHAHPLFARLMANDITALELTAINRAHLRVFTQVEAERSALSLWPELSLETRMMALRADLSHPPKPLAIAPHRGYAFVLGGLYVAFGSAFGAQKVVKSLKRALPDAAVTYYEMKDPEGWHLLCTQLECLERPLVDCAIDGANAVFDALLLTPTGLGETIGSTPPRNTPDRNSISRASIKS